MEKNIIDLMIPDNVRIAVGKPAGEETYKQCENQISSESLNVLRFPEHVTKVIGSFFTGFFFVLSKSMSKGEIAEHFVLDSTMPCFQTAKKEFDRYIKQ